MGAPSSNTDAAAAQLRESVLQFTKRLKEAAARAQDLAAPPQDAVSAQHEGRIRVVVEYLKPTFWGDQPAEAVFWVENQHPVDMRTSSNYITVHTCGNDGSELTLFTVPKERLVAVQVHYPAGRD